MAAKKLQFDYKKIDMKVKIGLKRLCLAQHYVSAGCAGEYFDCWLFALFSMSYADTERHLEKAIEAWPDLYEAFQLFNSLDAENRRKLMYKIHKELIVPFCKDEEK